MTSRVKTGIFLGFIFSGLASAQQYNHTEAEKTIVDNTVTGRKYGIKDIKGKWIFKPTYYYIEDFYDDELNFKDSVAVFYNSNYYKNSTIFLGNRSGLISNTGKIIIPDVYDKLICQKGTCAASSDKKTFIIDYHNNKKSQVFDGQAKYYKDSLLILESKQGQPYVHHLRSGKTDGPFDEARILQDKDVYYTSDSFKNEKAFHRLTGEPLLLSDEIYYQYTDNFFADDVYIVNRNNRKLFKNLKGQTFAFSFDRVDAQNGEIFNICPETKSGGDYSYCPAERMFSIFDILKGLGEIDGVNGSNYNTFSGNNNFPESRYDEENIPPVNIISKNNTFAFANAKGERMSGFYSVLRPSFNENEDTFYFEKKVNGKTVSGIIENHIETVKTEARVIHVLGNHLLVFDKEKNHYKIISENGEIMIKENAAKAQFAGLPFGSDLYTLERNGEFFTVDDKGKMKKSRFQRLSNFYNGFAFALQKKGEVLLVDDRQKIIKKLPNLAYHHNNIEIDPNGNAVFEDKQNRERRLLINYRGEVILDRNLTGIQRVDNYIYRINSPDERGYTFTDKNRKLYNDDGEDLKNGRIFRRKNYFYIRVREKDSPPVYYFFDNSGNFLGKDLPLYKQSIKEY